MLVGDQLSALRGKALRAGTQLGPPVHLWLAGKRLHLRCALKLDDWPERQKACAQDGKRGSVQHEERAHLLGSGRSAAASKWFESSWLDFDNPRIGQQTRHAGLLPACKLLLCSWFAPCRVPEHANRQGEEGGAGCMPLGRMKAGRRVLAMPCQ